MRVLVVCLGNICRSPAGEAALRAAAPDWSVDSAGLGDWHAGDPPYGPMQEAARVVGFDLSRQRARQITSADFHAFDLILAMDASVQAEIDRRRPRDARARVEAFDTIDVPDPYYTRDFSGAMDQISRAAERRVSDRTAPPSG